MEKYNKWIEELTKTRKITGLCKQITEEMNFYFPELKRVRGHYHCWDCRYPHWWLVTKDGIIVDPTASQFSSKGNGRYEEWEEKAVEPTGKCMNCGEYTYAGHPTCSSACYNQTINYLLHNSR